MMEISTSASDSSLTNQTVSESSSNNLDEGEQLFYDSIKKDLDMIQKEPSSKTIKNIMKYSKSL